MFSDLCFCDMRQFRSPIVFCHFYAVPDPIRIAIVYFISVHFFLRYFALHKWTFLAQHIYPTLRLTGGSTSRWIRTRSVLRSTEHQDCGEMDLKGFCWWTEYVLSSRDILSCSARKSWWMFGRSDESDRWWDTTGRERQKPIKKSRDDCIVVLKLGWWWFGTS